MTDSSQLKSRNNFLQDEAPPHYFYMKHTNEKSLWLFQTLEPRTWHTGGIQLLTPPPYILLNSSPPPLDLQRPFTTTPEAIFMNENAFCLFTTVETNYSIQIEGSEGAERPKAGQLGGGGRRRPKAKGRKSAQPHKPERESQLTRC